VLEVVGLGWKEWQRIKNEKMQQNVEDILLSSSDSD
jgi:hypothetical protein